MSKAVERAKRHGWTAWRAGRGWVCMIRRGSNGVMYGITIYDNGVVEA